MKFILQDSGETIETSVPLQYMVLTNFELLKKLMQVSTGLHQLHLDLKEAEQK